MSSLGQGNPNSLKVGDTEPLVATLTDARGPINLAGCTVEFRMKSRVGGAGHVPIAAAAIVLQTVDGNGRINDKGMVQYDWGAGETGVAGIYGMEWAVTFADMTVRTFPNDRTVTLEIIAAAE